MPRLTDKDYREVLNLIYLANRCEDIDGFVKTLFPFIIQVFNVECATFHLIDVYSNKHDVIEARSFKSDSRNIYEDSYYPALYKNAFYQYSPLLREALSSSKIVLNVGQAVSCKEWEKSILYNDFIRPQYLYWELFMTLRWQNILQGMVTLWRSKKQPEYNERDISKAEMVAPHLMTTLHNIRLISQINTWKQHFLSNNDSDKNGLIRLDHKFAPVFFNDRARDICMQLLSKVPYRRLNLEKGEFPIPSCLIKDCCNLLDLLKRDEQLTLLPKESLVVTETGKTYRTECALVWKTDQMRTVPNFIITLTDLTEERKFETDLQVKFHLSKREMDIIHFLTQGLSDDKIAEHLYLSKLTIHTHRKNIYRKLGVKNVVELYQAVIKSLSKAIV